MKKIIVRLVSYFPTKFIANFDGDAPNISEVGTTAEEAVGKLVISAGHRMGISVSLPEWETPG